MGAAAACARGPGIRGLPPTRRPPATPPTPTRSLYHFSLTSRPTTINTQPTASERSSSEWSPETHQTRGWSQARGWRRGDMADTIAAKGEWHAVGGVCEDG